MPRMYASVAFLGAMLSAWSINTHAFSFSLPNPLGRLMPSAPSKTSLFGGVGVANTYSWNEEQFEIEVKLTVPAGTSAKDVKFKCSSESIDLRLLNCANDDNSDMKVLLDGSRKVRGTICVDGTFWSIEGNPDQEREITITVEKLLVPVSRTGGTETFDTMTDFDWGGVYPNDEEEVSHRKYDEAKELDVREYAAKMGVDIDNIDMSKVNKTMFGTGVGDAAANEMGGLDDSLEDGKESGNEDGFHFNITQAALEQLTKSGLAKEVVQQNDGTEYEFDADGSLNEDRIFSMLGDEISNDELREAGIVGGNRVPSMFMDQTLPVEEAPGYQKTFDVGNSLADGIIEDEILDREITSDVIDISGTEEEEVGSVEMDSIEEVTAESSLEADLPDEKSEEEIDSEDSSSNEIPIDPIDMLKVARLKEILRAQGLKVSGTKQVLRDRLRSHVNALVEEE